MTTISIDEMRNDPLGCIQRVEAGETLVVLRDERAVAEIKPVSLPKGGLRPFGLCAGQFILPDDFNDPLPEEILAEFEGS